MTMPPKFRNTPKPKTAANLLQARLQSRFQEGLSFHHQGELGKAQAIYEEILKVQPKHGDALNLLGVIAMEKKNPQKAVELIGQALEVYPDSASIYSNHGNALRELGQFQAAVASYNKAIALQPSLAEAYFNRATALSALHQPDAALASYDQSIAIKPDFAEAYLNRSMVLTELHRLDAAVADCDKAIALSPNYAQAYFTLGRLLRQLGQLEAAIASYDAALALKPDFAEACFNRGNAFNDLGQMQAALHSYDQAIVLKSDHANAFFNRGIVLEKLQQPEAAVASYDRAIALQPDFAEAYSNRGIALKEIGQFEAAVASYDRAIALKPDFAEAYSNRGDVSRELKQFEVALKHCDKAIELEPDFAAAYLNRGTVLLKLHQFDAALLSIVHALELNPAYAEAHCNHGNALLELRQAQSAVDSYDKAIELKPDYTEAWTNRCLALQQTRKIDAALASIDQAIAIKPDFAEAWCNRGILLYELKRYDDAIESFEKTIVLKTDHGMAWGSWIHTRMLVCAWKDLENHIRNLLARVERNEMVTPSFHVLALTSSSHLQRKAAGNWVTEKCPLNSSLGDIPKHPRGEKIRIGYFSMDFRNHAVSLLTAELFESHDRARFEIYAFSFGVDTQDEMRVRLEAAFDAFLDVRDKSDREVAELARKMRIDIAIDLAGFTLDSRTGIFALRAAPVQINYLGYSGTMGAPYIDYLIADKQLIPQEARSGYAEKIVYLPSFLPNDSKRKISDVVFGRQELGLPESGFVFCCFNNSYKITPGTFDGWMRILKKVNGSVLWLAESNPIATGNLRKEAMKRGVDAQRLVFAPKMPSLADHLARHRAADLFLDTLPYNAHTTASDALWAGLPVLTCTGEALASRVAASLLTAIDLPELVTTSQDDYEVLAMELANNPERLRVIRRKLERNRLTTLLFDTPLFTQHIEEAYTQVIERYQADLAPDHIHVASRRLAATC